MCCRERNDPLRMVRVLFDSPGRSAPAEPGRSDTAGFAAVLRSLSSRRRHGGARAGTASGPLRRNSYRAPVTESASCFGFGAGSRLISFGDFKGLQGAEPHACAEKDRDYADHTDGNPGKSMHHDHHSIRRHAGRRSRFGLAIERTMMFVFHEARGARASGHAPLDGCFTRRGLRALLPQRSV